MKVAVAGGTGVAGRWAADALRADGHEAIVIARSAGTDLVTGNGLEAVLAGVDAVIDATNVASWAAGQQRVLREASLTAVQLPRPRGWPMPASWS